jgi:hypothetical protein
MNRWAISVLPLLLLWAVVVAHAQAEYAVRVCVAAEDLQNWRPSGWPSIPTSDSHTQRESLVEILNHQKPIRDVQIEATALTTAIPKGRRQEAQEKNCAYIVTLSLYWICPPLERKDEWAQSGFDVNPKQLRLSGAQASIERTSDGQKLERLVCGTSGSRSTAAMGVAKCVAEAIVEAAARDHSFNKPAD